MRPRDLALWADASFNRGRPSTIHSANLGGGARHTFFVGLKSGPMPSRALVMYLMPPTTVGTPAVGEPAASNPVSSTYTIKSTRGNLATVSSMNRVSRAAAQSCQNRPGSDASHSHQHNRANTSSDRHPTEPVRSNTEPQHLHRVLVPHKLPQEPIVGGPFHRPSPNLTKRLHIP